MRLLILGLVAALCCAAAPGTKVEDPLDDPGWRHFYNNEFQQALEVFEQESKAHPQDPQAYNHVAQAILYRELYRNGALESQLVTGNNPFLRRSKMDVSLDVAAQFKQAIGRAMVFGMAALKKDPDDENALYALSVAYGLRSNYLFLVEKAWTDALRAATQSREYSDRVLALDPGMVDADLVQGVHDYVVGSLPFYMRFLGFLAGFHGNREGGIREIEKVAEHGVLNKYDARILLAVIYRRERRPKLAIPLLQELSRTFPRNNLFRLEQVQMYSDAGEKNAALAVLADVERLRASGAPGYAQIPREKLVYLRGNLLFWYGDLAPALEDMKQATAQAQKLDLATAVLAWLRLGQLYDLSGEHKEAVRAYRRSMKTAPRSEAASEAKGYIESPYRRQGLAG